MSGRGTRAKLVRLVCSTAEVVDALSMIVFADNAYAKGRRMRKADKENIPRALFEIPVQAAVGGKVIARRRSKAMRKDVLAKCYGGDITVRRSCWKSKRKAKKMRQLGSVTLPSEAFTAVLKLDSILNGVCSFFAKKEPKKFKQNHNICTGPGRLLPVKLLCVRLRAACAAPTLLVGRGLDPSGLLRPSSRPGAVKTAPAEPIKRLNSKKEGACHFKADAS